MLRTDTQDNAIFAFLFMRTSLGVLDRLRGQEDTGAISGVKRESRGPIVAILLRGENPRSEK
jgi:hypothetical protein